MEVADAERRELVLGVVIAVHAQHRDAGARQRGEPRGLEVAERDDDVGTVVGDEARGVGARRLVGEGEEPHGRGG